MLLLYDEDMSTWKAKRCRYSFCKPKYIQIQIKSFVLDESKARGSSVTLISEQNDPRVHISVGHASTGFKFTGQTFRHLYQLSMGTLNSPSSRVVEDLTPSRHQILRCINFGIGESSPNLFLNMLNLYLVKFEAQWVLNKQTFYYFVYLKVNLDLEKTNQLGESSLNFIFTVVNFDPIVIEKKVNWWWILT